MTVTAVVAPIATLVVSFAIEVVYHTSLLSAPNPIPGTLGIAVTPRRTAVQRSNPCPEHGRSFPETQTSVEQMTLKPAEVVVKPRQRRPLNKTVTTQAPGRI